MEIRFSVLAKVPALILWPKNIPEEFLRLFKWAQLIMNHISTKDVPVPVLRANDGTALKLDHGGFGSGMSVICRRIATLSNLAPTRIYPFAEHSAAHDTPTLLAGCLTAASVLPSFST
ncbi:MAG: hypothetical protein FWF59_13795 [Turicibacter sp.]|nr:hypothetical protein [Turicibacter sp.]